MTEEQISAKKQNAGEKKTSMKRRDDHHDYTERRMYMLTLEVEGRRPVFGRLVGDAFAPAGSVDEPRIELSELGKAVQSEWLGIHNYYPQIDVMAVQMMPDHIHGILFVKAQLPVHLGQVISGFKAGCRRAEKALGAAIAAAKPLPTEKAGKAAEEKAEGKTTAGQPAGQPAVPPLSQQAAALPSQAAAGQPAVPPLSQQAAALPSQGYSQPYRPLFAEGYNDLILRSYDELPTWQNYLRDNPRRALMKRARPEWLRPFFGLNIRSHTYNGIGNRGLLAAPRRMAVRVSRRLNDQEVEAELRRYLEEARQGTVLVSPAISPGEKRVMRAAFDAGFPTIVVMENGFMPLSKPHGEQFYACGNGRLLMLSAWEHHNEKKKLTADQCRRMNLMALELCEQ
jgi:hypothetical protein